MRKINYILLLVIIALASCSKEQPLVPSTSSNSSEIQMIKKGEPTNEKEITKDPKGDDDSITDPEKEEKEKTNKKAKN